MSGRTTAAGGCRRVRGLGTAGAAALALAIAAFAAGPAHAATGSKPPMPRGMLGIVPNTPPTNLDLTRVARAGAAMVRRGLNWSSMQRKEDGPIDWDGADHFMVRAAERGLAVDLVAGTTPKWARS